MAQKTLSTYTRPNEQRPKLRKERTVLVAVHFDLDLEILNRHGDSSIQLRSASLRAASSHKSDTTGLPTYNLPTFPRLNVPDFLPSDLSPTWENLAIINFYSKQIFTVYLGG